MLWISCTVRPKTSFSITLVHELCWRITFRSSELYILERNFLFTNSLLCCAIVFSGFDIKPAYPCRFTECVHSLLILLHPRTTILHRVPIFVRSWFVCSTQTVPYQILGLRGKWFKFRDNWSYLIILLT